MVDWTISFQCLNLPSFVKINNLFVFISVYLNIYNINVFKKSSQFFYFYHLGNNSYWQSYKIADYSINTLRLIYI